MGPLAGVQLQELIIKATPAAKDQDHLEVVCFTFPSIPDRTESLENDGGASFSSAVLKAARFLEDAGATVLAIPCNTAHAKLEDIQGEVNIPVLDMIDFVIQELKAKYANGVSVGLLATNGTLKEKIYEKRGQGRFRWIIPDEYDQKIITQIIYGIKGGVDPNKFINDIEKIVSYIVQQGAESVVLGCTELSLFRAQLQKSEYPIVDPLTILAERLVSLCGTQKKSVKRIELYSGVR